MKRTVFLIPLEDNDGRPFDAKLFRQTQKELLQKYGGFQVDRVEGQWLGDDGNIYRDKSLRYIICMEEDQVGELKEWLKEIRDRFRQMALWLEVSEVETNLI